MKEQLKKITSNPLGSVAGAGAGWLVATRLVKTEKLWLKLGISLAGAFAGAYAQQKMKAKSGVPTAEVVKK
jgi:hypothetical protein